jgi:tRNA-specific 2-thiouridylase
VQGQRQVVVAAEPGLRRIVVGPRGEGTRIVSLRDINWLVPPPAGDLPCEVKLRARDAMRQAVVRVAAGDVHVELAAPALPAPGQACVFYAGNRVLGGGIVTQPRR